MPPRFVNKMRNAVCVVGEDAQFTCVIQSAPTPKIRWQTHPLSTGFECFVSKVPRSRLPLLCRCRWFKEGRLLTDQEKYQTYSEPRSGVLVLVIKNLTERDLGHYECEVG